MTNTLPDNISNVDPVDLTNCDREPIHILGRVQAFGFLISVSPDWIVNHASENTIDFIGHKSTNMIGMPIANFLSEDAIHTIRTRLQTLSDPDDVERIFGLALQAEREDLFDVAVHVSGRAIIIEGERNKGRSHIEYSSLVRPMISRVRKSKTIEELCDSAARQLRALTGFDRVMVYKFANDDSGEVISESLRAGMEPYKGLRYPASDIPKQARELYKRSLIRIISDVADEGCTIEPALNPNGEPLDLSMSTTRAVSPIHLEYLRNMGVGASMSVSILKRGKLWGLFACHHDTAHVLSYELRSAAELFGQMFSFVLDQKEADLERENLVRAQVVHDQLMAQLAGGSTIFGSFEAITTAIESVIPFDGAVCWIDGQFRTTGQTPTEEEFLGLLRFLNTTAASRIYATDCISKVYTAGESFATRASGMLVLPVSRTPRDYIVLFRQEVARSVKWAGNPQKSVTVGPNGARLTPRKSFAAWQEIVRHASAPWLDSQVNAAEALRVTILEVVLRLSDAALHEQKKSQERQELLIAELNHRVRNILNLIRGLVSQSASDAKSVSEFTQVVGGRVHALARAHDQITQENWNPASFYDLIRTETDAYLGAKADRVRIDGPDALLKPAAYTTVALVVHEMITNAAKYGALIDSKGSIEISMRQLPDGALEVLWREQGGPPIKNPPSRRGFGTTIIERSIPFELKGKSDVRFEAFGLRARFEIPGVFISEIKNAGPDRRVEMTNKPAKTGLSGPALIVEDNMIIALDAEDFLTALGAGHVHVSSSVPDAFRVLDETQIEFALLDVNLGTETSEPVARRLQAAKIPFAFATGYGEATSLTKLFPGVPVIQKPYSLEAVAEAIAKTSAG